MNYLLVFLGGGLGAVCRFAVSRFFGFSSSGFPLGTLMANVISCLILGLLLGWIMAKGENQKMMLFLMTGFCGGFSTFSSFSADALKLFEDGQSPMALMYILISVIVCILSILIGMRLFSTLFS